MSHHAGSGAPSEKSADQSKVGERVPVRDRHPWRAAVSLTILLIVGALTWSVWLSPLQMHVRFWMISTDSWSPLNAGRFVAAGAYPYLYEADHSWVAGPLLPVVLAPIAAIQDALRLTSRSATGYAVRVANGATRVTDVSYPSIWWSYATYSMVLCGVFLVAVRKAVWGLLTRDDRPVPRWLPAAAQIALTALGLSIAAAYWMHEEDVLALAMLLFALCAIWRGRWTTAAICCGLSIAFKQWTVLPILLVLPHVPPPDRRRFYLVVAGIPAVLYGIPLLAAPAATMKALFHARSGPWLGHAAAWIAHPTAFEPVAATPGRIVWVVIAVVFAWLLRRRTDAESLLAGAAVVFAARMGTESLVLSYYLLGVIVFATLLEVAQRRSVLRSTIVGVAALAWFWVPPHVWWWFVEIGLVSVLVWPAIRTIVRPGLEPIGHPRAETGEAAPAQGVLTRSTTS